MRAHIHIVFIHLHMRLNIFIDADKRVNKNKDFLFYYLRNGAISVPTEYSVSRTSHQIVRIVFYHSNIYFPSLIQVCRFRQA